MALGRFVRSCAALHDDQDEKISSVPRDESILTTHTHSTHDHGNTKKRGNKVVRRTRNGRHWQQQQQLQKINVPFSPVLLESLEGKKTKRLSSTSSTSEQQYGRHLLQGLFGGAAGRGRGGGGSIAGFVLLLLLPLSFSLVCGFWQFLYAGSGRGPAAAARFTRSNVKFGDASLVIVLLVSFISSFFTTTRRGGFLFDV